MGEIQIKGMQFSSEKHIFLCGMMGAGKTTVGLLLADALDRPFHDLDTVIEIKTGLSIPEIFARYSEKTFREIESKALFELIEQLVEPSVIALGGGTLTREENTSIIKQNGLLLYLVGRPDVLSARVRGSARPMLQPGSELARINELLAEREKSYRQATLAVDTSERSAVEVLQEILRLLRNR